MLTLGIIPARIGSSEVKKKNLRLFLGQPLVAHTVEAALASGLDRVLVSTDSNEIAEIARAAGAEVPFLRPASLSTNDAIAMSVLRHAVYFLAEKEGWRADAVAYLQPTSPLRTEAHIDRALGLLDETTDSVCTVVPVTEHPYYMYSPAPGERMLEYVAMPDKPERRQDLPPLYHINPAVPLSWSRYLMAPENERALVVNRGNFRALIISREDGVDINSESDFRIAELLAHERRTRPDTDCFAGKAA